MVGEVAGSCKRLLGTAFLYDVVDAYRSRFSPTFLQRNITTVLRDHEQHLEGSKHRSRSGRTNALGGRRPRVFDIDLRDSDHWQLLIPDEIMTELLDEDHGYLEIRPQAIRLPKDASVSSSSGNQSDSPAWFPRNDLPRFDCDINIALTGANDEKYTTVTSSIEKASIRCVLDQHGRRRADLTLRNGSIKIPWNAFISKGAGTPARAKTKNSSSVAYDKYRLRFFLSCKKSRDSALLLDLIGAQSSGTAEPGDAAMIVATYHNLPQCADDLQLPLHVTPKTSNTKTASTLDVLMRWHLPLAKRSTPLAAYNSLHRDLTGVEKSTTLAREATVQTDRVQSVSYLFRSSIGQIKKMVSSDLKCLWCSKRGDHSSFDYLLLHYRNCHDHFQFTVLDSSQDGSSRSVEIELADRPLQRASNSVSDEREMEWTRPSRPFDLSVYLDGDDSWTTGKLPPRRTRQKSPIRFNSPGATTAKKRKEPEEVGPLATRTRRRHKVPKIPSVTLFRNISKRKIEPGEMLSESDDEVAYDWLKHCHRQRKVDNLDKPANDFINLYDNYMEDEMLNADAYLGDALVRFCRRQAHRLSPPAMRFELERKLNQLLNAGLIEPDTSAYCLSIVMAAGQQSKAGNQNGQISETDDVEMQDVRLETPRTRTLRALDDDEDTSMQHLAEEDLTSDQRQALIDDIMGPLQHTPVFEHLLAVMHDGSVRENMLRRIKSIFMKDPETRQDHRVFSRYMFPEEKKTISGQDGREKGSGRRLAECECGKIALGRGKIECTNISCRRGDFHLTCVGLAKKVQDWKCPDCRVT